MVGVSLARRPTDTPFCKDLLGFGTAPEADPRGLAHLEALTQELKGYEMKVTQARNITYSNNPREGGPEHDDLVLACALALWLMRQKPSDKLRLL